MHFEPSAVKKQVWRRQDSARPGRIRPEQVGPIWAVHYTNMIEPVCRPGRMVPAAWLVSQTGLKRPVPILPTRQIGIVVITVAHHHHRCR